MKSNMTEDKYQEILKTAPQDHFSDEFVQFLRDNNEVISESDNWLIISNIKDPKDYTAFYIESPFRKDYGMFLHNLSTLEDWSDREWKIKAPHKRSVKLFHVHLILK